MGEHDVRLLAAGGAFFEGPRWHDDRWWVSDFYRHGVYTYDRDGSEHLELEVPAQPSGLGWLPDGSLLVVAMQDRAVLRRRPDGSVATHADLAAHCGGLANDMVVDASGRAYVGDFGFDLMAGEDPRTTSLKRVDPDGSVSVVADGLEFPNGSVITPDGSTLIVGETMGARYRAFSISADGSLSAPRIWADMGAAGDPVGPDGCALDAEDHIWSADALGGRCVRIAPGGAVVDEVPGPEGLGVFVCMLGGEEGRTLLLCTAPDFAEASRSGAREAVLWTTAVSVPHAGRP